MSRHLVRSLTVALSVALAAPLVTVGWVASQSPDPTPSPGAEQPLWSPSAEPATSQVPAVVLPLEGPAWRLASYRVDGEMEAVAPETAAWLTLRRGRLRGSTGCDQLRGTYGRVGSTLAVRLRGSPSADCPDRVASRAQRALVADLESAASFELLPGEGDDGTQAGPEDLAGSSAQASLAALDTRLVVHDELGTEVLHFELDDVGRLEGDEWRLEAYTSGGERFEAVAEPPAVLELRVEEREARQRRSAGRIIGSSGCNGLVGTFARAADALRFSDLEVSDAPCPEDLARQQETMLSVLGSELLLDLPPDRLVLTDPSTGDRLEFVAASPLEGSTWLLTNLRGERPFPDVTLRLEGGVVEGEGPCGPYGGRYETNGVVLRLVDLVGGTQPCEAERQQADYLDALRRAVLVERPRGRLRLHDAAGRQLARFRSPQGP